MDEYRLEQWDRLISSRSEQRVLQPQEDVLLFSPFFQTEVYRGFAEVCDECRRFRTIGVCYGSPGSGKTLAARRYAQWDGIEPLLTRQGIIQPPIASMSLSFQVALYTLGRNVRPKQLENDIALLQWSMQNLAQTALQLPEAAEHSLTTAPSTTLQLLIFDNVHRLDAYTLDVVQDVYDRYRIGVILLGSTSLVVERSALKRHEHLRTRIGPYYPFRLLTQGEMHPLIEQMVASCKIECSAKQGCTLNWLVNTLYQVTLGNVSLIGLFLIELVSLLQKSQSLLLTETLFWNAYRRLRFPEMN